MQNFEILFKHVRNHLSKHVSGFPISMTVPLKCIVNTYLHDEFD